MQQKIYPCLWFDNKAKEAAKFYCSLFPNSKIVSENPIVVMVELNGNLFMCLNGGPMYKPSSANSYVINCDTQAEIDHLWNHLSEGGIEMQCGWVQDKYGFSWQIVPTILSELMNDSEKAPKVIESFLKMKKFDIETLLNE
jgi:predicted 3-demethylubiquinone-9 3-methyltransferase (glyoxalase superfamily)